MRKSNFSAKVQPRGSEQVIAGPADLAENLDQSGKGLVRANGLLGPSASDFLGWSALRTSHGRTKSASRSFLIGNQSKAHAIGRQEEIRERAGHASRPVPPAGWAAVDHPPADPARTSSPTACQVPFRRPQAARRKRHQIDSRSTPDRHLSPGSGRG